MFRARARCQRRRCVPIYLLCHHHAAGECRFVYAAWKGFDSPLRHATTLGSCACGGHELWWVLEAADRDSALRLLPEYVAARTRAVQVDSVAIP